MGSDYQFDPKQMEAMGFVWELLISLVVPIGLFALLGRWLDGKLDTSPWLLVASFPFAIFVSYKVIRRQAEKLQHDVYDVGPVEGKVKEAKAEGGEGK